MTTKPYELSDAELDLVTGGATQLTAGNGNIIDHARVADVAAENGFHGNNQGQGKGQSEGARAVLV